MYLNHVQGIVILIYLVIHRPSLFENRGFQQTVVVYLGMSINIFICYHYLPIFQNIEASSNIQPHNKV